MARAVVTALLGRLPAGLGDGLAALVLAAALISPSWWARLYFPNNSADFLVTIAGVCVLLACTLVWLLTRWGAMSRFHRMPVTRALVATIAGAWIWTVAWSVTGMKPPGGSVLVVGLLVGVAGFFGLSRLEAGEWRRWRLTAATAATAFVLAPSLLSTWQAPHLKLLPPVAEAQRIPTIWILLDETGSPAIEQLSRPLRDLGLFVQTAAIEPGGINTLDVVPSILLRSKLGSATAPCGPATVCAGLRAVDFARVDVGRPDVDLIGFHHPYCAMKGWRSCVYDDRRAQSWALQSHEAVCTWRRWHGDNLGCDQATAAHVLQWRDRSVQALWDAPFWTQGGDVFIHLLLPHLPASARPMPSLAAAYEVNLERAARLLGEVGTRLRDRFPRFRLVVFADHALRRQDGCGLLYGGNCERPVAFRDVTTVPWMVASPEPLALRPPRSNLDIFDLDRP